MGLNYKEADFGKTPGKKDLNKGLFNKLLIISLSGSTLYLLHILIQHLNIRLAILCTSTQRREINFYFTTQVLIIFFLPFSWEWWVEEAGNPIGDMSILTRGGYVMLL